MGLIVFLIYLMMIELVILTLITLKELRNNLGRLWIQVNYKKCFKGLLQMDDKLQDKIFITSWLKNPFDSAYNYLNLF
jgi:hypothetical protein